MKFLRKRIVIRALSSLLLVIFIQSVFLPYYSYALTTGPQQTEFTSFESAGSTDMVDLLTGDFTYSMPVIEVPSPESSFKVPLFYHAGITPEQDASWTGLGFNINVGCITRDIAGYPDDAYDQSISVNVNDPGGSAWAKNYVLYKRNWDSEKGYGGGITLLNIVGADWNSNGLTSGTFMGMNFNKSGVKGGVMENILSVASTAATAVGIVSSAGLSTAALAKTLAMDYAFEIGMNSSLYQRGTIKSSTFSSKFNDWDTKTKISHLGFRVDTKYWLDDTRTERAFGSLYLGSLKNSYLPSFFQAPNFNTRTGYTPGTEFPRFYDPSLTVPNMPVSKGFPSANSSGVYSTSDMYTYVGPSDNYANTTNPTHISYDRFNVMSPGLSGSISPYRLETGSLSQPKRYSYESVSQNLVPFIEENNTSNKVQFYFDGQFSNNYLYQDDATFGISYSTGDVDNKKYILYDVTTDKLKNARVENDPSRINGKKIISGKNIEWFTNEQISSGSATGLGFIDYVGIQSDRFGLPQKGIGGFSITKEDGLTYHYALPVFKNREINFVGKKNQEATKFSKLVDNNAVAITWLLTAITGPDFVDRGQTGLVDDEDWGYWVKFDYGKTTNNYTWRNPYYGYIEDNGNVQYSFGIRDEYYLNAVETRSHVALFIKGVRTDGLSSYLKRSNPSSGHQGEVTDGALDVATPPLYLDEIALLTKADFKKLSDLGFKKVYNTSDEYLNGYTHMGKVYDLGDVSKNSSYRSFLDSRSLKRVKFVYETDEAKKLCNKTLNSFPDRNNPPYVDEADVYYGKQGKLTLKRLQFYGRNTSKVLPDYIFEYGFNPDYDQFKWDGWGYYNSQGTSNTNSHIASSDNADGAAWSLSKIILPTGGEVIVNYERDTYSSISGKEAFGNNLYYSANSNFESMGKMQIGHNGQLQVGDNVRISGIVNFTCPGELESQQGTYEGDYIIAAITANGIDLNTNYMDFDCNSTVEPVFTTDGTLVEIMRKKKGGNLRVTSITYNNEFGQINKTKYTYDIDEFTSSGVVAKEPDFIKPEANSNNYGLDYIYDYPATPVLYSAVTVHTGYNAVSDKYSTKQIFEFETPHKDMTSETRTLLNNSLLSGFRYIGYSGLIHSTQVSFKQFFNKVDVKNSKIGKLKSIKILDSNDVIKESTLFDYTETPSNNQGKYTAGSMLSEIESVAAFSGAYTIKLLRTVKTYHPYVLSKITHTKDNFVDVKEYKAWDFYTGNIIATETTSPTGLKMRSETVPAYTIYPQMGLKSANPANKNLVMQEAASYVYKMSNSNTIAGLISANVQTWKSDWSNYSIYNPSTIGYDYNTEGVAIWRKANTFSFYGDYLRKQADGSLTFSIADKFDFNPSASNLLWKKTGSTERFDHYSMPLEAKDFNSIYSSLKMGYNNNLKIAEASNAKYNEIAFSSAEDPISGIPFFGGEVGIGNGTVQFKSKGQTAMTHTGDAVVSLPSGSGSSFIYKASNLSATKTYRASVWANSTSGRIYYKLNGGSSDILSSAPTGSTKVGDWYRIDIQIPTGTTSIEVGVKSASGVVLFDDFRFQPAEAAMTCYVYNPLDFELTSDFNSYSWVLDNDNLYTMFMESPDGLISKTYRESILYGGTNGCKLVSETKSNYRRFHIGQ